MKNHLLKTVAFLLVFSVLFADANKLFSIGDYNMSQHAKSYYGETAAVDGVFIGASNVYAFWQAPLAWKEYGIAVSALAFSALPPQAIQFMIEEARKTQPDALYIINLSCFKEETVSSSAFHRAVDYLPWSATKIKLIRTLADAMKSNWRERMEYYFPVIRFHTRWNSLTDKDFSAHIFDGLKAGWHGRNFLNKATDVSAHFVTTNDEEKLQQDSMEILDNLLNYCEENNIRVLFVTSPQALQTENLAARIDTICKYVAEKNFSVLNMAIAIDELGIDLSADYYDKNHTNIHGSLKFTHWFGAYLQEHYGFSDKRGDPAYASWDEAAEEYNKIIAPYTLDFERDHAPRDNSLSAPEIKLSETDDKLAVKWSKVKGADGYCIYQKIGNGSWKALAEVGGETFSYKSKAKSEVKYMYTVVPFVKQGETIVYGRFNPSGKTVTKK